MPTNPHPTVFITGASSGIGKASARLFADLGWNVVATMRTPEAQEDLSEFPSVLVTHLDVQDRASIAAAVEAAIERFGRIDVLINNAGYGQFGLFEATPREKVAEQFEVNVFGVMDVTRAVLPHMRRRKRGLILNVSSGAGVFTLPLISLYCASKFALEGFTESLSYELAAVGITVKLVIPHGGVTNTGFGERTQQIRAEQDTADSSLEQYAAFEERTVTAFQRMSAAQTISAEDVAEVIFGAATDGTARLRYFVGNDTRGFLEAKQERSDEEYVAFMRAWFAAKD